MSTTTIQLAPRKELDGRSRDGLDVRLLWDPDHDELTVEVLDSRLGDSFELTIDPAHALDAFHHPYAYAASRGISFADPRAHEPEPIAA